MGLSGLWWNSNPLYRLLSATGETGRLVSEKYNFSIGLADRSLLVDASMDFLSGSGETGLLVSVKYNIPVGLCGLIGG